MLAEGTTFPEMFGVAGYTLFGIDIREWLFAVWAFCLSHPNDFDPPVGSRKVFSTPIARKAAARLQ